MRRVLRIRSGSASDCCALSPDDSLLGVACEVAISTDEKLGNFEDLLNHHLDRTVTCEYLTLGLSN